MKSRILTSVQDVESYHDSDLVLDTLPETNQYIIQMIPFLYNTENIEIAKKLKFVVLWDLTVKSTSGKIVIKYSVEQSYEIQPDGNKDLTNLNNIIFDSYSWFESAFIRKYGAYKGIHAFTKEPDDFKATAKHILEYINGIRRQ